MRESTLKLARQTMLSGIIMGQADLVRKGLKEEGLTDKQLRRVEKLAYKKFNKLNARDNNNKNKAPTP